MTAQEQRGPEELSDPVEVHSREGVHKWRAFAAIAPALMTIVMSSTMVFVLLSAIADHFGVTLRAVGWVVIIESLIVAALLLPMGGLADAFGRRRVYVIGLGVFGLGSVLTGLAPTFTVLLAARTVMSIGNALVQSVMTAMLVAVFPADERGKALGAQTTAVAVGAAAGPLLGGIALQLVSWQTLFMLTAVPAAISLVAALFVLDADHNIDHNAPNTHDTHDTGERRRYDAVGGMASAAAVVALVFTISNPLDLAWSSGPILGGAASVVVILIAFVRWELRQDNPMLELRLFTISTFRRAASVRLLGFTGSTVTNLLLPIYLVSYRGTSASLTGTVLFLIAVGMGLSAQVSGNLSDRTGPRSLAIVGLLLQISIATSFMAFAENLPMAALLPLVFLAGVSLGLWNVPNNSAMMGAVPPTSHGVVGAFTNVTRTMGNVLGQALATAVVVAVMAGRGFDVPLSEIKSTPGAGTAFLAGWQAAYVLVIVVSSLALIPALRLPGQPVVSAHR